ncbi:MAG: hypothetical protein MUC84_06040 [Solirubrobacteraceae bacterium]|jgi:hypothetical protein|nr:hypothetical protein [Solirubrobacteraceae bacterium]MCU0313606.1 hypothetical protein [Solirubrobacteraceae bacterium]
MDDLHACERGLRRAGLPLLIEDYSPFEDVFTRAVPFLALVFVGESLGAIDLTWPWWANVVAVLAGVAVLLAAVALVNRRGGRPALGVPARVGPAELALFVLVPALLPLMTGQWRSAIATAASNLVLLGVVWAVVGYGVLWIVVWSVRRLLGQLATSFALLARAVPLLLVFSIVLFVNAEMWQVFSSLSDTQVLEVALLFVAVGTVFMVARVPREVREIERQAGAGTPPLRRHQLVNVGLVLVVAQGLQVLTVSVVLGAFFVAFGVLAIEPSVVESWIGSAPDAVAGTAVTTELLRVSGALAAFSGLYYAIAVLTDGTYREEFLEEVTGSMRATFRLRARYLALRAAGAAA